MSQEHHANKTPPSESKKEREILELRIDVKIAEAKESLRLANQADLNRIASETHEPRYKRLLGCSAVIIACLIASHLWEWFGLGDRIKDEAGKIIDQKLIDPQLTNTLDEALSKKAVPFIAAQVHPLEANIAKLKTNMIEQTVLFRAMTLDVSNKQARLASDQIAVRETIKPLFGEVNNLQSSVDAAQENANKLQAEQRLMSLMNRGEVFDKDAIQELQNIARGTNETAPLAQAMFNKIQRILVIDRAESSYVIYMENDQYSGPYTSDELASFLTTSPSPALDGVINMLGKKRLFVPILVDLANHSKDLWTINRIANALKNMADVDFFPWDLQPLNAWWTKNSMNYTNWPLNEFNMAVDEIASCKYDEALTNFYHVLTIDPTADKSRALAIACAIETGNLPGAQQLNTNFSIVDGRWKQWADGKMMLATNAIELGTEKFVSLARKNPTFVKSAWIGQGNNILRQVDWKVYSQLMEATNNIDPSNGK